MSVIFGSLNISVCFGWTKPGLLCSDFHCLCRCCNPRLHMYAMSRLLHRLLCSKLSTATYNCFFDVCCSSETMLKLLRPGPFMICTAMERTWDRSVARPILVRPTWWSERLFNVANWQEDKIVENFVLSSVFDAFDEAFFYYGITPSWW